MPSFSLRTVALLAVVSLLLVACEDPADPAAEEVVAFVDVNVLPMDREAVLEEHTVIVEDERITSVGPSAEIDIPDDAARVNGDGRYLMPGLAEMHGHIPGPDTPAYAENTLFLYVSNGVTTVRNMLGDSYHLELREQVEQGELLGPTISAASPWMSAEDASTEDEAEAFVREHAEEGFDLLKMGSVSPDVYGHTAETAHDVGIPFAGHIPPDVGLQRALDADQASIDHFDRYVEFLVPVEALSEAEDPGFFGSAVVLEADRDRISEAVDKTVEAGTWNVPTLSIVEHLASPEDPEEMIEWPEMQYMPQDVLDGWVEAKQAFHERDDFQPEAREELVDLRRELLRELHAAGAPIAFGSDAPQFFNVPGFSIHHEMEMMVDSGLTPYEVLATATRKPAEYEETPEAFGTVAPNRRADLILLEANPFDNIANLQERAGVMVRGEWLTDSHIQDRLDEIAEQVDE